MLKLALLVPVIFALGGAGGAGTVAVEGATPVSLGKKKGTAYPVKCAAPIKFSASGPASLIVDVRGKSDALSKPLELDFTRNDKAVSKNAVTLTKSKNAGKGFAGVGQVVLKVPEGVQQYALACDSTSDIAMSFRLSKKAVKTNSAVAEVAVEPPKPAEPPKPGPSEDTKPDTKPETKTADVAPPAAGSAPSNGAFVGLFTPISF
ncbi:MAG: hypothetical protein QOI41_4118 [Myxococcales bacterium]|jgi:hypothetical protein|nr:hypothetical protein [Myxococcales bacterium]